MKKLSTIGLYAGMLLGIVFSSSAQTITAVATNAATYCQGASMSVSFTAATFPVGTIFAIELSNAAGSFATPVSLGTSATSPATVTLPAATAAGAGYKVRVSGGTPLVTTAMTGTFAVNAVPAAPAVTTPATGCVNSTITLSATGTGLLWYAASSGGIGSATTPTPVTTTAGSFPNAHYVSQTVAGCESPRAAISVNVTAAPAAPTVTTPVTVCVNSPASLSATGTALLWYAASSGGVGSATTPTPVTTTAGSFPFYVSQTVSGCESPRATITVNVNARPAAAPTTATSLSACQNTASSTLSATPATGNTVRWYTVSTGGTALGAAPTPNTSVGSTTTYTYYVTQEVNNCEFLPRTAVTVTVNVTPAPTVTASLPVVECQGQAANSLSNHITAAASGFSLLYYGTASTGGTSSTTATIPSTTTIGTTSYYVVKRDNSTGCESTPRTAVSIQVNSVPTAPSVTSPVNLCLSGASSALSASASSGGTLSWWGTNAAGGGATSTAPTPSTATTGTVAYYVSQTVAGCQSSRAPISVVTNGLPGAPAATSVLYCQSDVATPMVAVATSGNTLKWYNGSSVLGATAPTPSTSVSSTTTYNYNVSQITPSPANCEGPTTAVTATVYFTPAPTVSNITYCQNDGTSALTATGTSLAWYAASSGGAALGAAPTPTATNTGLTTYYVTQRLNVSGTFAGCENIPRTPINVTVNPQPAAPAAASPIIYCQNYGSSPLTATGNTLKWYGSSAGGSPLGTAPTPNTSSVGSSNFYVSQTNGFSCESPRSTVTVTINPTPGQPGVGGVTFCQNYQTAQLNASINGGNTINWYGTNPSGGSASTNAPSPPTGTSGTFNYYVSQTNSFNCESPRATLPVLVNPTPSAPSVRTPDIYCQNDQPQALSVSVPSGNSPRWYDGFGNLLSGGTPVPNVSYASNQFYFVTQVNGFNCEGPRTQIDIVVKPLPVAPSVPNNNYILCQLDPTLNLSATGQGLRWYLPNGNISTDAPVISTGAGLQTSYKVSSTVNGCEGPKTQIDVLIRTTPLPTVPATATVFCQQNGKFEPLVVTGSNIKWYDKPTGGSPIGINAGLVFTETPGTFYYYVTQTNASTGCESPRVEIIGIVQPLPTATISGENSISQGQSATLKITFSGQGPWTYTLSNGFTATATVNQNPTTVTVTPLETTVYTVNKISNNCGNGTPIGSATINVKTTTVQTGNPNVASLCAGTSFVIPFFASDFIPSDAKYTLQISKTTDDASFQNIPTENVASPLKGTVPSATPGGSYYVRVLATASGFSLKGLVSPIQVAVRELPTATISGPSAIYENETAKIAISIAGESPWTLVYSDSLAQQNTSKDLTISPYEFSATLKQSNTYSIVSVSNACGNGPATSKLRIKVNPLLSVSSIGTQTDWIKVYPMPVQTSCIIEINETTQSKPASIGILDILGRVIEQKQTIEKTTELDLKAFMAGTYFIRIEQNGRVAYRKIIKTN